VRHAVVEGSLEAIERAKVAAMEDAERQARHDAVVAAARRDEATLLEQQRIDCRLAELRHHREEEGHIVKSAVKSPLPIRHLPPIKHDHTRVIQQQALLMQQHMEAGTAAQRQQQAPPASAVAGSPSNAARPRQQQQRPPSGGHSTADAMNDQSA
jgi:hypothetical protein